MGEQKGRVEFLAAYKRKKQLVENAIKWQNSLPEPSLTYPNLIFLYSEELATQGRDMLFRRLDSAAAKNKQKLVISDCHYSRAGFYIVLDEIGGSSSPPVDIDEIVEKWNEQDGS